MELEKYSVGIGDRFGQQAKAQLRACVLARENGIRLSPVWNKSNREHVLTGSDPADTRAAADAAVRELGWDSSYYVDADHITLSSVGRFLPFCDFFTLDVSDQIGKPASEEAVNGFVARHPELLLALPIAGFDEPLRLQEVELRRILSRYLAAVQEAGRLYRHICAAKRAEEFVTEISMDETDLAQGPAELLVLLAALGDEAVPLQTLAPKFSGRFNKGVDYVGDLVEFERQFSRDMAVVAFAAARYGLPPTLKLSVHSGSDKFALYPVIRRQLEKSGAGLHLKTAGTTWLEELAGLAESGADGLALSKEIGLRALESVDELCRPYATVVEIDQGRLPRPGELSSWTAREFLASFRHDPGDPAYNPDLRQLLHVAYKLAAEIGEPYRQAVRDAQSKVAQRVTTNLYQRHIRPLFPPSIS